MADETSLQFNLKRQTPDLDTDYDLCIICQSKTPELLTSLTSAGYPTLLYAVLNRSDDVTRCLMKDIENMDFFLENHPQYHNDCYRQYTNKKTVHQKRAKVQADCDASSSSVSNPDPTSVTRSKSNLKIDLKTNCFVCQKDRDKKGNRKLILIATKEREDSIWAKANELNERRMMGILHGPGTDMVSNNVRYHKLCLEAFMNKRVKASDCDMQQSESDRRKSPHWLCNAERQ